eukprot:TRINITY_DN4338_c0_g1_i1.p1 TRINITY_DN4338_c0_g1~~TRINITY_DN4338_c0_g1_i1.p1  ORF type:complete len:1313 (+),score=238.34 TRINITY_DN4338_c0_g1_i1:525-4463(+)
MAMPTRDVERRAFRFAIDRGGTFTDVYAEVPGPRRVRVMKLLSVDPSNYDDAPTEGIRRILEEETGEMQPRGQPLDTSRLREIRMGTTVATNALLERKGERVALLITAGFKDLLQIGNQSRPRIFDFRIERPELLYERVVEVDERIVLSPEGVEAADVIRGCTGELFRVERRPSEGAVRKQLEALFADGIRSIAVVLMHAYAYHDHEREVGRWAKEVGFEQVSLSHSVMPMVKVVPRGHTASVDAYLTPILARYIDTFRHGFDKGLKDVSVTFMRSDGGLTNMDSFTGHLSLLSGPAGGVVGYAATGYDRETKQALLGFDMGGTSTDVSRFGGDFEHVFETTIAGVTIQSPQIDINTVAAGGGSRLFFKGGQFVVGPESAGAHPGPVCYRKNGYLTIMDANVVLGRIVPAFFPHIFGPNEDEALDVEGTRRAFESLTSEVNAGLPEKEHMCLEAVALGFLRVANETMSRPIRNLTISRGYNTKDHALATFGGAGPQHCCAVAKALGIRRVLVNSLAGVLSAYGLSRADVVEERQSPCALRLGIDDADAERRLDVLESEALNALAAQGFEEVVCDRFLNLRYDGTDTALMTRRVASGSGYLEAFLDTYRREFGFVLGGDRAVIIDDARVRAVGRRPPAARPEVPAVAMGTKAEAKDGASAKVYFGDSAGGGGDARSGCAGEAGWRIVPLLHSTDLCAGHVIQGPAMILQAISTVVVEDGCTATLTKTGDIEIAVGQSTGGPEVTEAYDPVWLSIFAHRFMGIAEQMGRVLQRTSISVNIKERLDFSCALFDASGGLVANAPHLPVHLGAMQEAVRFQARHWGSDLADGDVLVSNHPQLAGGSHLPDITVITPVFHQGRVIFYTAARGHHADVGGIAPGSMPPESKSLADEGAAIVAFKLVKDGIFQEDGISRLLTTPGNSPGAAGTRKLSDNLSDMKAQVAANNRGVQLIWDLVQEYGLSVTQAYMRHIQANAETAVRSMLKSFAARQKLPAPVGIVRAEEFLDDGSCIRLVVSIDQRDGSAVFDFEGTSEEIYGNLNAPPAVTVSAIIYCLRSLIDDGDVPLNQGCLAPIDIRVPPNTFLNPSVQAAVVGGNVETSQRVTDVVLKAFGACGASQGTMNNLTFGDDTMGYYETICGGAGAGPDWDGCSGVHTHMTNTRITDPEILERRYPIILRAFGLRPGSGGRGRHRGGDGVIRSLEFTRQLTLSLLSERRSFAPYGLEGGESGMRGRATLKRARGGSAVAVGAKTTLKVFPGDEFTVFTPGGGGFGVPLTFGHDNGGSAVEERASPPTKVARMTEVCGSVNAYRLAQEQA